MGQVAGVHLVHESGRDALERPDVRAVDLVASSHVAQREAAHDDAFLGHQRDCHVELDLELLHDGASRRSLVGLHVQEHERLGRHDRVRLERDVARQLIARQAVGRDQQTGGGHEHRDGRHGAVDAGARKVQQLLEVGLGVLLRQRQRLDALDALLLVVRHGRVRPRVALLVRERVLAVRVLDHVVLVVDRAVGRDRVRHGRVERDAGHVAAARVAVRVLGRSGVARRGRVAVRGARAGHVTRRPRVLAGRAAARARVVVRDAARDAGGPERARVLPVETRHAHARAVGGCGRVAARVLAHGRALGADGRAAYPAVMLAPEEVERGRAERARVAGLPLLLVQQMVVADAHIHERRGQKPHRAGHPQQPVAVDLQCVRVERRGHEERHARGVRVLGRLDHEAAVLERAAHHGLGPEQRLTHGQVQRLPDGRAVRALAGRRRVVGREGLVVAQQHEVAHGQLRVVVLEREPVAGHGAGHGRGRGPRAILVGQVGLVLRREAQVRVVQHDAVGVVRPEQVHEERAHVRRVVAAEQLHDLVAVAALQQQHALHDQQLLLLVHQLVDAVVLLLVHQPAVFVAVGLRRSRVLIVVHLVHIPDELAHAVLAQLLPLGLHVAREVVLDLVVLKDAVAIPPGLGRHVDRAHGRAHRPHHHGCRGGGGGWSAAAVESILTNTGTRATVQLGDRMSVVCGREMRQAESGVCCV